MTKMVSIKTGASPDYDRDGYGWAMAQAAFIRAGQVDLIDWENVAEEIESVGKSEKSGLRSNIIQILIHMMKWETQPSKAGTSWWRSILNHRVNAEEILDENPSLRPHLDEVVASAHRYARKKAHAETGLPEAVFADLSFSTDQVFNRAYARPEAD